MTNLDNVNLLLDSRHGQYIPQIFANDFDLSQFNIILSDYDKTALQDIEHEWYWEAWQTIENNACYIDNNGSEYMLLLNGDLWLVCYEMMSDEEKTNFFDEY